MKRTSSRSPEPARLPHTPAQPGTPIGDTLVRESCVAPATTERALPAPQVVPATLPGVEPAASPLDTAMANAAKLLDILTKAWPDLVARQENTTAPSDPHDLSDTTSRYGVCHVAARNLQQFMEALPPLPLPHHSAATTTLHRMVHTYCMAARSAYDCTLDKIYLHSTIVALKDPTDTKLSAALKELRERSAEPYATDHVRQLMAHLTDLVALEAALPAYDGSLNLIPAMVQAREAAAALVRATSTAQCYQTVHEHWRREAVRKIEPVKAQARSISDAFATLDLDATNPAGARTRACVLLFDLMIHQDQFLAEAFEAVRSFPAKLTWLQAARVAVLKRLGDAQGPLRDQLQELLRCLLVMAPDRTLWLASAALARQGGLDHHVGLLLQNLPTDGPGVDVSLFNDQNSPLETPHLPGLFTHKGVKHLTLSRLGLKEGDLNELIDRLKTQSSNLVSLSVGTNDSRTPWDDNSHCVTPGFAQLLGALPHLDRLALDLPDEASPTGIHALADRLVSLRLKALSLRASRQSDHSILTDFFHTLAQQAHATPSGLPWEHCELDTQLVSCEQWQGLLALTAALVESPHTRSLNMRYLRDGIRMTDTAQPFRPGHPLHQALQRRTAPLDLVLLAHSVPDLIPVLGLFIDVGSDTLARSAPSGHRVNGLRSVKLHVKTAGEDHLDTADLTLLVRLVTRLVQQCPRLHRLQIICTCLYNWDRPANLITSSHPDVKALASAVTASQDLVLDLSTENKDGLTLRNALEPLLQPWQAEIERRNRMVYAAGLREIFAPGTDLWLPHELVEEVARWALTPQTRWRDLPVVSRAQAVAMRTARRSLLPSRHPGHT